MSIYHLSWTYVLVLKKKISLGNFGQRNYALCALYLTELRVLSRRDLQQKWLIWLECLLNAPISLSPAHNFQTRTANFPTDLTSQWPPFTRRNSICASRFVKPIWSCKLALMRMRQLRISLFMMEWEGLIEMLEKQLIDVNKQMREDWMTYVITSLSDSDIMKIVDLLANTVHLLW